MVAYLHGVQVVASSNLAAPTNPPSVAALRSGVRSGAARALLPPVRCQRDQADERAEAPARAERAATGAELSAIKRELRALLDSLRA